MKKFKLFHAFAAVLVAGTLFGVAEAADETGSHQAFFVTTDGQISGDVLPKIQKKTMSDMRTIAICVQAFAIDHDRFPGPTTGLVPVSTIQEQVQPTYVRELPRRDPLGQEYLYESDGENFRIVSYGMGGEPDAAPRITGEIVLTSDPARDIVWENKGFVQMPRELYKPRTKFDRRAMTMKQMRSLATAIESFAVDNSRYPEARDGLKPVADIRKHLEPVYIANMPANDSWGQPLLYWSDGKEYRIVSGGGDREITATVGSPAGGESEDGVADIIFEKGQFTQFPKGSR